MTFDPVRIRHDFPILSRKVRGKSLVYFDNAATTQKPAPVIEAISQYYKTTNANVHRGVHTLSEEATTALEEARIRVAQFIGAADPATIIFTRNTTEAINLVAYAWGRKNLKKGEEILLTEMEHHSNLIPWQILSQETGAKIQTITVTPEGTLDMESFRKNLNSRTRLVAFAAMSNVLGTINPIQEIVEGAHRNGSLVLVDGAAAIPHLPFNVSASNVDFLAFSGHKMLGPTGVGVLYGKKELLEAMPPFLGGGGMIQQVSLETATYAAPPTRFEAGTPDIAGAIGLRAAIEYLHKVGLETVQQHERELTRKALELLRSEPEVVLYGPGLEHRGGIISFNLEGVHPHDVGTIFDSEGVAIRVGHHCCQPLMKKFKISGTARLSFYLYNTEEELEAIPRALHKVKKIFKSGVKV